MLSCLQREQRISLTSEHSFSKTGNIKVWRQKYFKVVYIIPVLVLILLFGYLYWQTLYAVNTFTYTRMTMDTFVEIRFQAQGKRAAEEIRDEVFAEIERLENMFSRSVETSDVVAVNNSAGLRPVAVSPEVFFVTEQALRYAELSKGAFDPTVAPLTDLWGFFSDKDSRVPEPGEIESILQLVDYRLVEIDPTNQTIYLPKRGMGLELGGIAKGFIVDQALETFLNAGIEHAYVNAGDIGLLGTRPDGEPWRIGLRNPRDQRDIIAILPLANAAVDTSGDYERAFVEEGINYHHILDPETGMPARGLASVTVTAKTTMEADVLSTAAFVLGPEKGLALIEELPGAEGVFVTPEFEITITSGLEDKIEMLVQQD